MVDWLALATIATPVVTVALGWIGLREPRKEIKELHTKIGNGFADGVMDTLGEIASTQDEQRVEIGVLRRRMDAHVKLHTKLLMNQRRPPK